ncbi:MAG: response regulator [Bryobacterales bacterium]|nr:response regulator [Bryobacterales bacterium]
MNALKVLLVEDSPGYASLVLRWIAEGPDAGAFTLVWTDTLSAALARLDEHDIDLILMDLGLPDSDGLTTFLSLHERQPDVPVIVLSGSESEALAIQTIQHGAQDYLVKSDCTPELILRTLNRAVVRHQFHARQAAAAAAAAAGTSSATARGGKLIAVAGATGGAGATTVACVLAAEIFQLAGRPTALVDADCNAGQLAFTMGIESQYSIRQAAENAERMDREIWAKLVHHHAAGFDVLASSAGLALVAQPSPQPQREIDPRDVVKVLEMARNDYGFVVVDAGRLNAGSAGIFKAASETVLVTGQSISALHHCKNTVESLASLGVERDRIRLVLNRNTSADLLSRKEIERMFGLQVAAILPLAEHELEDAVIEKRLPAGDSVFRRALSPLARTLGDLPPDENARKRGRLPLPASWRSKWMGRTTPASAPQAKPEGVAS